MATVKIDPVELLPACEEALRISQYFNEGADVLWLGVAGDKREEERMVKLKGLIKYAIKMGTYLEIEQNDFHLISAYIN